MGSFSTDYHHGTVRDKVLSRFQQFVAMESSSGILLLLFTAIALFWANSAWSGSYHELWHTHFSIGLGSFSLDYPLHYWINDGLMALFFFLVGLEIKREVLVGELKSPRQALLPIFAAIGGMLVPAAIYAVLNLNGSTALQGWAIPMATDIAFALAIMALLGKRVPLALKIFLTAVAIVDDLGAILVIAIFYSGEIAWAKLLYAGLFLGLAFVFNLAGVRRTLPYSLVGIVVWYFVLKSGVHATIAGVLVAMAIPASAKLDRHRFVDRARAILDNLGELLNSKGKAAAGHSVNDCVTELEVACKQVEPPLQRIEHALQPWVAYGIMPLFALANAGVALGGNLAGAFASTIGIGTIVGLILGKQLGITLFAWLAVKLRLADLPKSVNWMRIYGAACLCGVGFTMALFIANLAFGEGQQLDFAKIGILTASLISGVLGYLLLARAGNQSPAEQSARH